MASHAGGGGVKTCTGCRANKPLDAFSPNKRTRDGLASWCKKCTGAAGRDWRRDPGNADRILDRRLQYLYGIGLHEYRAMVERQNGLCGICHRRPSRDRLVVDHNHKTGAVRGLLCNLHNRSIGLLGDDSLIISASLGWITAGGPFRRIGWEVEAL